MRAEGVCKSCGQPLPRTEWVNGVATGTIEFHYVDEFICGDCAAPLAHLLNVEHFRHFQAWRASMGGRRGPYSPPEELTVFIETSLAP